MHIKISVSSTLDLDLDKEPDIKGQIEEALGVKLSEAHEDDIKEQVQELIDSEDIDLETDTEIKIIK